MDILVNQLLDIKTKNFELFRFAIFNVLLKLSPEDTLGRVMWQIECPDWNDSCLDRLGERRDILEWIIWRLITKSEGDPITTKEHIKIVLDTVLSGHVRTIDLKNASLLSLCIDWGRVIIWFSSFYFAYVILAIAAILLLRSLLKKRSTKNNVKKEMKPNKKKKKNQ